MRLASLVSAVVVLVCAASAAAGWTAASNGDAQAAAATLAAGPTPTASAPFLSMTITVTWAAVPSATGYSITRANGVGVVQAAAGTCAGVVTGTSCSETVSTGTYRYSVAVRRGSWTGAAGATSAPVGVPGI